MSNLNSRIINLENARPERPPRIFVIHDGEEFGQCDGVSMSRAEFESTASRQDVVILVVYANKSKATDEVQDGSNTA